MRSNQHAWIALIDQSINDLISNAEYFGTTLDEKLLKSFFEKKVRIKYQIVLSVKI